jgi:Zn-dependent protease with chaperone function
LVDPGSGPGPSFAGRIAAAAALTVGFYVLVLALALAIVPWMVGHGNPLIAIAGGVLGAWLLVGIAPPRYRFAPPGVSLSRGSQPRLVTLIADEARACGAAEPDDVYATFDVDAYAADAGHARRVMVVGLPLLHLLSERGLRAVVAHELRRTAASDAGLAARIDRTRRAILRRRTAGSWPRAAVQLPYRGYGAAFLRITDPIERRTELAADAYAAQRAGRDVHVEVLQHLRRYASVFDAYWDHEVAPILSAGRRPPIGAGFAAFIRAPAVARATAAEFERALAASSGRHAAQPSLSERIDALAACPAGGPDDSPPAATLLQHWAAVERAQAVHRCGTKIGALRPISWHAVGTEVFLERAQRLVAAHGDLLGDATAGALDDVVDRLGPIAGELQQREPELEVEHARGFAGALMADGLLVALHESGWTVEAPPAEPVHCTRGEHRVAPHAVVDRLLDGRLSGTEWRGRAEALGIDEVPLASTAVRAR